MSRNLKEQILELHSKGIPYSEISKHLNCSKGTISYYCNTLGNLKAKARMKSRKQSSPLYSKIDNFKICKPVKEIKEPIAEGRTRQGWITKLIGNRIGLFQGAVDSTLSRNKRKTQSMNKANQTFTIQDLISKSQSKCYLTGRTIDFSVGSTYNLDHKIPRSKGGSNELDNCEVACKSANQAKSDLSVEEFFQLCIDVVKHNNLKI